MTEIFYPYDDTNILGVVKRDDQGNLVVRYAPDMTYPLKVGQVVKIIQGDPDRVVRMVPMVPEEPLQ